MPTVDEGALEAGLATATNELFEGLLDDVPELVGPRPGSLEGYGATLEIAAQTATGTLHVAMSTGVARGFASAMFGDAPDAVGPGECQDVASEVVNIVGGVLKGLVGEHADLGLPHAFPTDATAGPPAGARAQWFEVTAGTLAVWWEARR